MFDFEHLDGEIGYFDVFLRYSTGILDDVKEISVTKNSLFSDVQYFSMEDAFDNNALVVVDSPLSIDLESSQRVKISEDTTVSLNFYLGLSNHTQSSYLSQLLFHTHFNQNYITAQIHQESTTFTSILPTTSITSTQNGISLSSTFTSTVPALSNSTSITLCLTSLSDSSLYCSSTPLYYLSPPICTLPPSHSAISLTPINFTLSCPLTQLLTVNTNNLKILLSASVPSKVEIFEISTVRGEEFYTVKMEISQVNLETFEGEIPVNLGVTVIECEG